MRRIKVLLMLLAIVAGGSFAYGQTGPEDTYYRFDQAYSAGDAVAPYVGDGEDLIVQKAVVERATPATYMQDTYNYGISESTTSANPHYMLTFHVEASTENPAHVLLFGNAYFNSSKPKDQKWAIYSAPCNPSIPSKNLVVEKINPENPSPSCYEFVLTAAGDFHLYWFENFTGDQKAEIYGLRVIYENNALYQSIRNSIAIEMNPSTTTADELTTSFFRLINATFDNTNGLNAQGRGIYFSPYAKGTIELEITSDIPSNSVHLYMDTVVTTQSAGRYTIYSPTNLQIDGTLTLNHTITRKVYKGGEYRISCDVNSTDNCYIRTIRFIPDHYTVTLDPNGGTVDPTELYYVPGISEPITTLPTPTREGWDFDNWYREGEDIIFPFTPTANVTFTAEWDMTITLMSDGVIVHQESGIPDDETRTPDSQSCDANGRMFDYWTADQDVQIGGALVTAGTPIPDQTDVLMLRNTIFTAHWTNPHGQCGDNLTWEYDPSTTTLTIEGTGDMTDFGNLGSAPWNSYSSNITSISLPEGLTHIGNNAFYGCNNKSLTSITIPSTVTSIGNYAFHHCSRLKTVNIPDGVTSIGNSAFANAAITSVAIPASVTSIGTNPFTAADLASITVDPNNPNYDSRGDCNAIIETATDILISGCKNTVIPDDVVAIGTCAFENASGLEYLSIPASVASFGDYAFNKCTDLYMMFILRKSPAVTLGTNVFGTQGVSMHLPTIISVHEEAYDAYWNSWTSKYPDYVLYEALKGNLCGPTLAWRFNSSNTLLIYGYGGAMFDYASSDDVPWLGDRADIKKIEFYLLSGNITHIGSYAFYECNNAALTSITIPSGVTDIGFSAFRDCSSLTSITIPSTVTTIGGSAFKNCTSLTSITIPSGVTDIGSYAFDECSNLASANIPDGVTLIDAGIFNGCSSLDAITIPSGVTEIKQYAFHNTALTTIDIPSGVTSIGYYAFADCSGLTDVTVNWTDLTGVTTSSSAFNGVTVANVNLHVPAGTKSIYQAAAVWKDFNIVDPYSGQCGDNLTWEYDPATHTLTISGTGEMSFSSQPWTAYTMEIEKVVVGSGVTSIGSNAFSGCTSLTSATLPDGLTKIKQSAFQHCSSLASITIPNSVTDIGVDAFRGCSALTDIYVSWSYTQVPSPTNVFTDLTTSDIRLHFLSVGWSDYIAYSKTPWSDMLFIPHGTCGTNLTWELENNTLTITGSGAMEDFATEAPWIHFTNKSMCSRNYIGSIVLPNEVTSIGNNAFKNCSDLTDVTVNWTDLTGVTTSSSAFNGVTVANVNLHVPCGTKSQYEAVAAWSSFTIDDPCEGQCGMSLYWTYDPATHTLAITGSGTMYAPTSADGWPWNDFRTDITSISLPDGMTATGPYAFSGCTGLTSVEIPASVTSVASTFQNCTGLTDVYVYRETPASIHPLAFSGVTVANVNLHVPYGTKSAYEAKTTWKDFNIVEMNPSGQCGDNLTWEYDPSTTTLTITGSGDMYDYTSTPQPWNGFHSNITSIAFPNGITTIGKNAFMDCDGLTAINIPASVTTIGNNAFRRCHGLTAITLAEGLESIGEYAFEDCNHSSLNSLDIPASVTSIGQFAFSDCDGLTDVTVNWTDLSGVTCIPSAISYLPDISAVSLHVPCGTKSAYEAVAPWKNMAIDDPCAGNYPVTANGDPDNAGLYYSTFYYSTAKYLVPENVEAYAAAVSGTDLVLTKIADGGQTLPAATAVILKSTIDSYTMVPSDDAAVTITATNHLHGVDADTEISSVVTSGSCYVLSYKSGYGVGFYLYEAPNKLKEHKAYINLDDSGVAQAPRHLRFVFNSTTDIQDVQGEKVQGEKFLRNGVLYIQRGEQLYNAQGIRVE